MTQITRIVFDLSKPDAEAVSLHPVNGAFGDMPRIDDRFAMEKYRIGYFAWRDMPQMGVGADRLGHRRAQVPRRCKAPPRRSRCSCRASPDAPEGDGFVLTAVDRFAEKRTDLLILDGNDVSRPPLATVKLPFALPMAFHGSWMAAARETVDA